MCVKEEWAFSDRSSWMAEKIQPGDHGIVYLRTEGKDEPSAVGGSVDFLGAQFRQTGGGLFDQLLPVRMPTKVTNVLRNPVPFRPLVQSIGFIKHKTNWGSYLQGHAAIKLDEKDYAVLLKAVIDSVQDGN